jgi:hypothetical protein
MLNAPAVRTLWDALERGPATRGINILALAALVRSTWLSAFSVSNIAAPVVSGVANEHTFSMYDQEEVNIFGTRRTNAARTTLAG